MYCEKCGTAMKVTDKFCEKCGNDNLKDVNMEEKVEASNKKNISEQMNITKMKKYGVIAAVVVLILVSFTVVSKQVKKNSYIKAVQTMAPKRYPSVTFKEAFDEYFDKTKWEYYVSDEGYNMVKFTGKDLYDGEYDDSFEAHFWIDGKGNPTFADAIDIYGSLTDTPLYALFTLEFIFEEAYASRNYIAPNEDFYFALDYCGISSDVASPYVTELYDCVKYIKATPDMILIDKSTPRSSIMSDILPGKSTDVPASATVAVETEPIPVVEETKQLITYNTDSKDFELNWPEETTSSSAPAAKIYESSMHPDDVINAKFSGEKSDSVSMFYITKDGDGYRLYVEAANLNGRGAEKFSGYATEIGPDGDYELIFVFVSDHEDDWEYVGNDTILVAWRDYESIDHPMLIGRDTNIDYIFNGYYHFEENLAQ